MTVVHYLVDNNVLSKLNRADRESTFFTRSCRLPSEVLYEASSLPDIAALRQLEYPMSTSVLDLVRKVMSTVQPGDHELVDLYHVQGNADPILIAIALDAMDKSGQTLIEEDWQVVSDDKAVRTKAGEFDITVLTTTEFVGLLRRSSAS